MAIIETFDEEEKGTTGEDQQDIGALAQGAAPAPQAGTGQAVGGQAAPTSSGSFTNLQKFITANRPKIQRQGEQTTERLGGDIGQAQETYGQRTKEATEAAKAGTLDTEAFTGGKSLSDIAGAEETGKYIAGKYAGPSASEFQTGSQEDWTKLRAADEALKATGTQAGLAETLQQDKSGGYGRGLSRLNAALMGREATAQAGLGAAREQYAGAEEQAGLGRQGTLEAIEAARAASEGQGKSFKDWYEGKRGALETGLTTAAQEATTRDAELERVREKGEYETAAQKAIDEQLHNSRLLSLRDAAETTAFADPNSEFYIPQGAPVEDVYRTADAYAISKHPPGDKLLALRRKLYASIGRLGESPTGFGTDANLKAIQTSAGLQAGELYDPNAELAQRYELGKGASPEQLAEYQSLKALESMGLGTQFGAAVDPTTGGFAEQRLDAYQPDTAASYEGLRQQVRDAYAASNTPEARAEYDRRKREERLKAAAAGGAFGGAYENNN
jgi:hypothetical protein